jgi:hypothetical protein
MRKTMTSLAAMACAVACTGAVSTMVPAAAATDHTPPTLTVPARAGFVTGSAIGAMAPLPGTSDPGSTYPVPMRVGWHASDASGICGSSSRGVYAGSDPDPWTAWGPATSLTADTTDYDDQEGGGSFKLEGYDVRVRDCAGNVTQRFVSFRPVVYQEDGASYGYGELPVRYHGAWSTSSCGCWSGGTTRKTSARGARAVFTLDTPTSRPVALVTEAAPDRGRYRVLVDGVSRGVRDTYAATPQHRTVTWAGTLPAGTHTVAVVDLATSGRPRIDLDALLVSQ